MRPEDSAEYLRSLIALPLSDTVDAEVAQTVARLRAVFYHGLFDYDLFTAASDLAYLAVEGALRRRFMVGYGGRVPFVHKDRTEYVEARSFDDVHEAVRRTGPYALGKGWRLAGISAAEHPGFDSSFTALLTWARREGLLQGQRNRVIERALVRLRNLIAHPERFHRTHPVSAALPIRDAIEVINRLWGAMSDGGRLYPVPARRTVVVLARNPDGTAQWTGHPESLHERVAEEADWVTYLLRAVPNDELWDYREGFESTAHPAELLWGPGPMAEALKAWVKEGSRWEDDSATVLDRAFFVRYPPGSDEPEPPRSRKAAEQLPASERSGRWLVVVADHPWAAFRHGRHAVHRGELKCGWCGSCQATSFDIHRSLAAALRVDADPARYP